MAKIKRLSDSALHTYACPYRFQQKYLRDMPEEAGGEPAQLGSVVHDLIAQDLHEAAPAAVMGAAPTHGRVELPPLPHVQTAAEDLLARWQATYDLGDYEPLGIEMWAEAVLDDMSLFIGRLDLVADWHGTLVVVDWKTNRYMPRSLSPSQLASYAWLACEAFPEYAGGNVLLVQWYVRQGRPLEVQITPQGRANVLAELTAFSETLADADDERDWPAAGCEQCSYCALKCPLGDALIRPPQGDWEAEELAGTVTALEQQTGKAKAALRKWIEHKGAVTGGGRTFAITQGESPVADATARQVIEKLGDKGWPALRVDPRKLGGMVDEGTLWHVESTSARMAGHKAEALADQNGGAV